MSSRCKLHHFGGLDGEVVDRSKVSESPLNFQQSLKIRECWTHFDAIFGLNELLCNTYWIQHKNLDLCVRSSISPNVKTFQYNLSVHTYNQFQPFVRVIFTAPFCVQNVLNFFSCSLEVILAMMYFQIHLLYSFIVQQTIWLLVIRRPLTWI